MKLTEELLKNNKCKDEKQLNKYINKFPEVYDTVKKTLELEGTVSKYILTKAYGNTVATTFEKLFGSWENGIDLIFPELGGYKNHVNKNKGCKEKVTIQVIENDLIKKYKAGESIAKSHLRGYTKLESHYGNYETAVKVLLNVDYNKWFEEYMININNDKKIHRTDSEWLTWIESNIKQGKDTFPKRCPQHIKDLFYEKYGDRKNAEYILTGSNSEIRMFEKSVSRASKELIQRYKVGETITKCRVPKRISEPLIKKYGSYTAGVKAVLNIDYNKHLESIAIETKKKMQIWTEDTLKAWLLDRLEQGLPCNYSAVNSLHVFDRILGIYGTYASLWEACGIDYEAYKFTYRESIQERVNCESYKLSVVGHKFEDLLDRLFTEFGFDFTKHHLHGTKLKPDYIIDNGDILGDAKLTFTYKNESETIEKYLSHCNHLEMYYLNSNFLYKEKIVGDKTVHHYNINKLISQAPPEHQDAYMKEVKTLRDEVKRIKSEYKKQEACTI